MDARLLERDGVVIQAEVLHGLLGAFQHNVAACLFELFVHVKILANELDGVAIGVVNHDDVAAR